MSNITPYVRQEVIPENKVQLVKDMIMKGASDSELQLFISNCNRTGLDPMNKQCWAVKRWDTSLGREVFSFQTGVDGFRIVANRSGKYAGQLGPYWCGGDGEWKDVWLSDKPPIAAKVGVLKDDFKEPLWAVAKFSSYAAKKKDGSLTPFWLKMPDLMIAKVAECLALRKAFPQDLSGIYSDSEMDQASIEKDVTPKLNPVIQPEEIAHCGVQKESSHIIHTKPESNPQDPQSYPQKKEPERFPKKEEITISKEQAEFLKSTGHKFGYKTNEISKVILDITGKESWGAINNVEFELILQHIIDNRKGL